MHKVNQRLLSGLLCLALAAGFAPTIAAADMTEIPAETEPALIETVEAVIGETEAATVETTEVLIEETEAATVETTEVAIEETEAATVETTAEIEEQSETIAAEEIVPAETAETVETVAVEDNSVSPAESSDISSGTPDGTPPVLVSLELEKTTVTAPGTIEVTAEATDDVSGVSYMIVSFDCEETGKNLNGNLRATYWENGEEKIYPDGKLHGTIEVDQYLESGIFTLDRINVYDVAGNYRYYSSDYNSTYPSYYAPIPDQLQTLTIQVINALPDVTTSVAKPEFLEEVKNAEEDAYIVADYSGNATVPEDVFDAISGTDKTLDLVSEGITWRFEGKDIVNDAKDIDLHVEIKPVEQDTSETGKDIQDALEEVPAVVMKFPENGTLPGKATIQVKVDYTMQEYLGTNRQLSVYYFNNQTGELELIASNLTVNGDSYVEFPITHCSYYILTVEPAAEKTEVIPVYRLYNPYTQEHLLTGGTEERDALISVGWSLDGVAWEAPKEGIPVYRLYNPYDDWHTYTTSESERDTMVAAGWTVDGVVSFGYTGKDGRPIYRLFNPYVQTNYHLFTAGAEERDQLVSVGWILEGTAWYSVK